MPERQVEANHRAPFEGAHSGALGVAVAGHPVQPMLSPVPIGAFALAPVCDVIFWVTGDFFWARAAWVLLIAGLILFAIATTVAVIDFALLRRIRESREGWFHLFSTLGIVGLGVANVALRWQDRSAQIAPIGTILSVVTLGLVVMAIWYGGELTYRHRIEIQFNQRRPHGTA